MNFLHISARLPLRMACMTFTLLGMTTPTRIALVTLTAAWAVVGLATATVTHNDEPPVITGIFCGGELASWPAVVGTHGADAPAVWAELVADGWTNPRSGDVTLLVPAGCADSY